MTKAEIDQERLEQYLRQVTGNEARIEDVRQLGGSGAGAAALKAFGYGKPLLVIYRVNDQEHRAVLRQVNRNGFGREMASDRVAAVWLDFTTFNRLPNHVAALDMAGLSAEGQLQSIASFEDVLLLTDYAPGRPYADDLARIRDEGVYEEVDLTRARALARFLATIHSLKHDDPLLWRRRLRDLIGHGEGIMGLTDSYPVDFPLATSADLRSIEEAANRWRWRLKPLVHRLSQVHGDFHPFNVLFTEGQAFQVIDRSRGPWGEPADDVSCMSINYLFFSLQRSGQLAGPFEALYRAFWETYLAGNQDPELLDVIQPWFAWRALVLASPQWYSLTDDVRRKLLTFARQVLMADRFAWMAINDYLGG